MKITNEIKAKVFSAYLGYYVTIKDTLDMDDAEPMWGVDATSKMIMTADNGCGLNWWDIEPCKLILTPLSKITDEDAIEVAKILTYPDWRQDGIVPKVLRRDSPLVLINTNGYKMVTIFFDGTLMYKDLDGVDTYTQKALLAYQFLQSKGYDLPNYLLDGKTLIESGLAIKTA